MGSRGEKKQPGALVGEKSQTVYSANWKLDTMLQKNLQMLDVSKHRVGHRISMDQRVVNKRFQIKLNRSKLTHARMTGNRDLLRELIHRDNYTFNTSVGGQDDKYKVKISPTHTPIQQSSEDGSKDKETLKYGNGKGVRPAATPIVVVEPIGNARLQGKNAVYRPGTEAAHRGNSRPLSSVSIAPRTITRRPATAVTARPRPTLQSNPSTDEAIHGNPEKATNSQATNSQVESNKTNSRTRPKTAMPGLSKASFAKPARPKTAVTRPTDTNGNNLLKAPTPEGQNPSPQTRPNSSTTNHQKKRPQSKQKHTMPSIFGEEKRPTLLDLNKERLNRANFPDRVKTFAGTLAGFQTDPDQTVDYYTLRLLENLQCASRKGPRQYIESEAERRDADRSIGNLNALNMTFGDVTMDLDDHKRNNNFPVRATVRAWESDDDEKDEEKKG